MWIIKKPPQILKYGTSNCSAPSARRDIMLYIIYSIEFLVKNSAMSSAGNDFLPFPPCLLKAAEWLDTKTSRCRKNKRIHEQKCTLFCISSVSGVLVWNLKFLCLLPVSIKIFLFVNFPGAHDPLSFCRSNCCPAPAWQAPHRYASNFLPKVVIYCTVLSSLNCGKYCIYTLEFKLALSLPLQIHPLSLQILSSKPIWQ